MIEARDVVNFDVYKRGLISVVYYKGVFYYFSTRAIQNNPAHVKELVVKENAKTTNLDFGIVVNTFSYKGNLDEPLMK